MVAFERSMNLQDWQERKSLSPVLVTADKIRSEKKLDSMHCSHIIYLKHEENCSSSSSTSADIQDNVSVCVYRNDEIIFEREYVNQSAVQLKVSLAKLWTSVISDHPETLIDLTYMGVRLLAIILSSLCQTMLDTKERNVKFFCGYAEPETYTRRGIQGGVEKSTEELSQFKLYSEFAPLGPLPNFDSTGSDMKKQLWVVLLGFEGYRTSAYIADELPQVDDIIALVTVPAAKLGWSNYATSENAQFFRAIENKKPGLQYVNGLSPFSVYNKLLELQTDYDEYRMIISPFSSKVNSLGVLLYALINPECEVIYDNPLENSRQKQNHSGQYHIYEITQLLKKAVE